jgi:hypothetical protein
MVLFAPSLFPPPSLSSIASETFIPQRENISVSLHYPIKELTPPYFPSIQVFRQQINRKKGRAAPALLQTVRNNRRRREEGID